MKIYRHTNEIPCGVSAIMRIFAGLADCHYALTASHRFVLAAGGVDVIYNATPGSAGGDVH